MQIGHFASDPMADHPCMPSTCSMAAVCRVSTIHQVAEAHEVHHSQSRLDPFRWAELAGFPAREAAMPLDHTRLIDTSLRLAQMPLPASFATASSGWVLHFHPRWPQKRARSCGWPRDAIPMTRPPGPGPSRAVRSGSVSRSGKHNRPAYSIRPACGQRSVAAAGRTRNICCWLSILPKNLETPGGTSRSASLMRSPTSWSGGPMCTARAAPC